MPTMRNNGGLVNALSRFWQRTYAADYLGFIALLVAYLLIQMILEPFHRMFSLDDLAIQYPHAVIERVTVFWNIIYAVLVPIGIILVWAIFVRPGSHTVHVTLLGFVISILLSSFVTDLLKNVVGRPRPDLIARCKPKKSTPQHQLVTIDVCTEKDHHILHDGWRSFPSGHSSLAFSGLGFFALFLAGQMHIFRPRTDLTRVLVAFAPLIGAALIAVSRFEDYRHDVYDITAGSLLGIMIANFSYRRYFPALRSSRCDVPLPSRAEQASSIGINKNKDEESRMQSAKHLDADGSEDELEERLPLRRNSKDLGRLNGSDRHS